jgi:DNA helicase-2/ATP-dependent DNA helicase PcrA
MDRLTHLNSAQREAVLTLSGPLLVLAGAGTGKTRVITHRMAELIHNGTPADRILSVTFTNKAAGEMQERTANLLGKRLKPKPFISTFHSLCVRILRQEIACLGYPLTFVIYDRGDQESAARTALRDIRVGEKTLRPGDLLTRIGQWKTAGVSPKFASEVAQNDSDFLAAAAYRRYQANVRACGAVDFDDLLLLTRQLFEEFPAVLARQQARFDHVQIDEYQDTNTMQFALMEALVRKHRNLCVVGDDDQSIYGWRGAEIKHILGFHNVFPGAKVIRLEDNYRCTDQILKLANQLVRHNRGRHDKKLVPHKFSPDAVRFAEFPDEQKEAELVVRDIDYLIQEQNVPPSDFAILFRTNEQPRVFETELRRKHLPYVMIGASSFFDRREIRDMLAYLKVLAQPADEMSLLRIINTPTRGIGAATVEKVLSRAVKQKARFWEVVPEAQAAGEVPKAAAAALRDFHDLLERYRRRIAEAPRQLCEIFKSLVAEINYEDEINKQYKDPGQQMMRSEALDQMADSMQQYIARAEQPTLTEFLEESTLTNREDEPDKDKKLSQTGIKLMTLHSAKGLEFPRVYLVGLEEGILPHHRSLSGSDSAIEEERRLTYVGITRARDFLTITRTASRMKWGKRRESIPSRFLFEMREETPRQPPPAENAGA